MIRAFLALAGQRQKRRLARFLRQMDIETSRD
jgi:hypothetical protein